MVEMVVKVEEVGKSRRELDRGSINLWCVEERDVRMREEAQKRLNDNYLNLDHIHVFFAYQYYLHINTLYLIHMLFYGHNVYLIIMTLVCRA